MALDSPDTDPRPDASSPEVPEDTPFPEAAEPPTHADAPDTSADDPDISAPDADADPPAPATPSLESFEALGLSAPVLRSLREMGFEEPTPVQLQAIPYILQGQDVVAQ